MVYGKGKKILNLDDIDEWLEKFFLDPLTSYLDETTFRIDIFETADELIVQALLSEYKMKEITVLLNYNQIMIGVSKSGNDSDPKQRMIPFAFRVIEHEVTARFEDGILEVYISKNKLCKDTNRIILINK